MSSNLLYIASFSLFRSFVKLMFIFRSVIFIWQLLLFPSKFKCIQNWLLCIALYIISSVNSVSSNNSQSIVFSVCIGSFTCTGYSLSNILAVILLIYGVVWLFCISVLNCIVILLIFLYGAFSAFYTFIINFYFFTSYKIKCWSTYFISLKKFAHLIIK